MKKRILSMVLCLSAVLSLLSMTALAAGRFADVKSGDYFAEPVEWAVELGITNGTGDGTTFSPNDTCTKAQILTFLWRAAGSPEPGSITRFIDVKENDYFYKAAQWASEKGIVPFSGSVFAPDTPCTRGSTVEYFWRFANSVKVDRVPFSDISAGSDLEMAVSWAVDYGITNGTGGTTFSPDTICTRGQIVTFLHRYFVTPLDNSELIASLRGTSGGGSGNSGSSSSDVGELDPLPPVDYKKQPDWYGTLTPAHEMSNARLVAELEQIEKVIAERQAQDIYMSDGPYSRQLDLWSQASQRYDIVERYDRGINDKISGLSERARKAYEELVATYGDADPLREYFKNG